jgi:hypothetical protein
VRHQVRLKPVLQSLCDTLDKVYRDKRVTVVFDFKSATCPSKGALLELLGNLLENAYRLCLSKVRITWRKPEGTELCIEDDGPGVPPTSARGFCNGRAAGPSASGAGHRSGGGQGHYRKLRRALTLGDSPLGGAAFKIHCALVFLRSVASQRQPRPLLERPMERRRFGKPAARDLLQGQIRTAQVIDGDVPPQFVLECLKAGAFLRKCRRRVCGLICRCWATASRSGQGVQSRLNRRRSWLLKLSPSSGRDNKSAGERFRKCLRVRSSCNSGRLR